MLTSTELIERINAIADYNADGRPREYLIMDDVYYVPTNRTFIPLPLCAACARNVGGLTTRVIQVRTDHGRTTLLYHTHCFYDAYDISAELDREMQLGIGHPAYRGVQRNVYRKMSPLAQQRVKGAKSVTE